MKYAVFTVFLLVIIVACGYSHKETNVCYTDEKGDYKCTHDNDPKPEPYKHIEERESSWDGE